MDSKITVTEYFICIGSEDTWIIKLQRLRSFIDKNLYSCNCTTICIQPFKCFGSPNGKTKLTHVHFMFTYCSYKTHVVFIFFRGAIVAVTVC